MASEITQRQRAAQFYNSLLKGTGVLGHETPRGRFKRLQLLLAHDQQTRQEAMREAVVVAMKYREQARQQDLSGGYTSELIATELDRLAREGREG